ncbi:hypothetical protein LWI28_014970 [Acer negundo]|uniref:Uncharacterized protein n=1 Tax=Acer negundo TaxID=4023 RepID=A0AAD5P5C4_ACENE|nr:hypothetical protein LWI28_014970 [Acer negundo]
MRLLCVVVWSLRNAVVHCTIMMDDGYGEGVVDWMHNFMNEFNNGSEVQPKSTIVTGVIDKVWKLSDQEPEKTNAQHATWDAENSMVMAWLVNSMEENVSENYHGYSTTKDMWNNLTQMYYDLEN